MISVPLINKWVWSQSDVYQHLSHTDRPVTGWTDAPVYPINEQPESEAPYIVYTWVTKPDPVLWQVSSDEITFYLWDHDTYRMMQLESALRSYLGREDMTAEAINQWANAQGDPETTTGGVLIKSVRYGGSTQIFTQTQESGVFGKGMTFKVDYINCETNTSLV